MARSTIDEVLRQARERLTRLSPGEAYAATLMAGATLVDVRTGDERARDGRLPGSLELSLNVLEWRLDPASPSRHLQAPDLDELVILICREGYSSSLGAVRLQQLGFRRATDVAGGVDAWVAAGLPMVR